MFPLFSLQNTVGKKYSIGMNAPVSRKLTSSFLLRPVGYITQCSKLRLVAALAFSVFASITAFSMHQIYKSWKKTRH